MKINIKTIRTSLTPSLKLYAERKLSPLAKFVKRFDETGEAEIWLEVQRFTKHHRKGEVFEASADLRLPKHILRAENTAADARVAIDKIKKELNLEIQKYRTRFLEVKKKLLTKKK